MKICENNKIEKVLEEQDKSCDIEQQPPFGDRKKKQELLGALIAHLSTMRTSVKT